MFYYPQFLQGTGLVNIQVVLPGGWSQDLDSNKGLHFLWEPLLFCPTPDLKDPDAWLWENTLDFWTVTSYESVRLNFTLKPEQVTDFIPVLKQLLQPRSIDPKFAEQELHALKTFWQTERDVKEDQALRQLFPQQNVVHPNPAVIDDLTLDNLPSIEAIWQAAEPFLIVLGHIDTDEAIKLSQLSDPNSKFITQDTYQAPSKVEEFFTKDRWGLKFTLNGSHIDELLLIELWDQVFGCQFFFEYHQQELFIWTNAVEHPKLLAQKVKSYPLTQSDFNRAKTSYLKFLDALYTPQNSATLEKMVELTEGLHPHKHQSATYQIDQKNLLLNKYFDQKKYSEFLNFYQGFVSKL